METPSFNIREIERRRETLIAGVLTPYVGHKFNPDEVSIQLHQALPTGIPYDAVFESTRYLAGQQFERKDALGLAWRLAGNIKRLKEGQTVLPWTVQFTDEWVPLQILRVERTRDHRNRIGYSCTFRVMAGSPAAMKIINFWNQKIISNIPQAISMR